MGRGSRWCWRSTAAPVRPATFGLGGGTYNEDGQPRRLRGLGLSCTEDGILARLAVEKMNTCGGVEFEFGGHDVGSDGEEEVPGRGWDEGQHGGGGQRRREGEKFGEHLGLVMR